ncbi:MAG: hypothetical protein WAN36_08810, partial [Calditrichia bacterium]
VKVILSANYFDERKVREIASKIGGEAVIVPLMTRGAEKTDNYFQLMDLWINRLKEAFSRVSS